MCVWRVQGHVLSELKVDFDEKGSKGFRVLANADVPKHARVFTVPPSLWVPCSAFFAMQDMQANAPELVHRIRAHLGEQSSGNAAQVVALATRMMMHWEGHLTSPHDPYYDFLNTCVPANAHPLLRSDDELSLLKVREHIQAWYVWRRPVE